MQEILFVCFFVRAVDYQWVCGKFASFYFPKTAHFFPPVCRCEKFREGCSVVLRRKFLR